MSTYTQGSTHVFYISIMCTQNAFMHSYKPHSLILSVIQALYPGGLESLLSVCPRQGSRD